MESQWSDEVASYQNPKPSHDRVGALQAYLRQAVLNRIRDEVRKGRQPPIGGLEGLEPDPAQSPLEQAIGQEAVARYERSLERLRPEEQEAIIGRLETARRPAARPRAELSCRTF